MTAPVARLVRQFIVLGAGNYGAMALSLGINALLARRLGADRLGQLALLLMTSQVASLLSVSWTQNALVRFGAAEFGVRGTVDGAFWTRFWIAAPSSAVVGIALMALRAPLSSYLGVPQWALLLVFLHFISTFFLMTVGALFQARGEMQSYGMVLFGDKAVLALLVVLMPSEWRLDPTRVISLYTTASASVALLGLASLRGARRWGTRFDAVECRRMLAFAMPFLLSSWVVLLGSNWFDFIVLKAYRPVGDVGLYSLGASVTAVVQQIAVVFSTFLLPQLSMMVARGEDWRISRYLERVVPYWILGTALVFSIVVLNAGWAVPFVFGREYARSVPVVIWLMQAAAAVSVFNAMMPLLTAMGATWTLSLVYLLAGAVNVVGDFALVPRFGIEGAALATVVANMTAAVVTLVVVQRRRRVQIVRFLPLMSPVLVTILCTVTLDGPSRYMLALVADSVMVWALVRSFGLFQTGAVNVFAELKTVVGLGPSAPR